MRTCPTITIYASVERYCIFISVLIKKYNFAPCIRKIDKEAPWEFQFACFFIAILSLLLETFYVIRKWTYTKTFAKNNKNFHFYWKNFTRLKKFMFYSWKLPRVSILSSIRSVRFVTLSLQKSDTRFDNTLFYVHLEIVVALASFLSF